LNKIDWREIFRQLARKLEAPPQTKPTPLPDRLKRYLDGDQDAGIDGDEAFELNREKQAMHGWNK
jgi:hypothetical protein